MGKIRGTHSSPGHYTQITDLQYAAKNFGITTLGLVGETLKGPAFEPIAITDWREYVSYFGGTSAEKFRDTLFPKYELPYIAKDYLSASDQLYVCRVLGFSGYNAGKAFVVTAKFPKDGKEYPILVLRSRGSYTDGPAMKDNCEPDANYDKIKFRCDEVVISKYTNVDSKINGCVTTVSTTAGNFDIDEVNSGRFTIIAKYNGTVVGSYPVSLNQGDKDYIYNVLGVDPINGNPAVFVEELYDVMISDLVKAKGTGEIVSGRTKEFGKVTIENIIAGKNPDEAADFVNANPSKNGVYLYSSELYPNGKFVKEDGTKQVTINDVETTVTKYGEDAMVEGYVYQYLEYVDYTDNGEKITKTGYFKYSDKACGKVGQGADKADGVKVAAYNRWYIMGADNKVTYVRDFSDYHEQFRCAVTPWIVSELKGTGEGAQVKRLFRFYTISDGKCANEQVKISIANIRPDDGTFDVLVRDYNDGDASPVILESYKGLNMIPGDRRYIGLRIGTANGDYELKSKYVMVDVIEDEVTKECVPAGFLGYPVRDYGNGLETPFFSYNTMYNEEIREKKQYFGLSDLNGVDVDMLTYKGVGAYTFDNTENITKDYLSGYTAGFHLDARLAGIEGVTITIDGNNDLSGATWSVVGKENKGSVSSLIPVISTEARMKGTIYEDINLRKFTVYPYGGFDGWDIYRGSRTNTDAFKATKYKGTINGDDSTFSTNVDATTFNLPSNYITSDYYAYLAGARQFENPEIFEINLFATPGIDYVHQNLLSSEIVDMIENRLDCFYVITTPDKPAGSSYSVDEMFSAFDAAENVDAAAIDTYYASTYYPWARYYDSDNNVYINLPATRDVVRNMADTDNKRFPWIAPAGLERGVVNARNLRYFPKLEDRDKVYDNRINSLIKFSKEGIRVWGQKTLYVCDETNPMNRINTVRGLLYIRKVIIESTRGLFFEPNDGSLKDEFESIVRPILDQAEADHGIYDYRLEVSQTTEQMDQHELSGSLFVEFTPDLEYIELNFVVTPLGISFDDIV